MLFDANAFHEAYEREDPPGEIVLLFEGLLKWVVGRFDLPQLEDREDLIADLQLALIKQIARRTYKPGNAFAYFALFLRDRGINILDRARKRTAGTIEPSLVAVSPPSPEIIEAMLQRIHWRFSPKTCLDIAKEFLSTPGRPLSRLVSWAVANKHIPRQKAQEVVQYTIAEVRRAALKYELENLSASTRTHLLLKATNQEPLLGVIAQEDPDAVLMLLLIGSGMRLTIPNMDAFQCRS